MRALLKKLGRWLLLAYVAPLARWSRLRLYAKDVLLLSDTEHLERACSLIRNHQHRINPQETVIDVGAADGGSSLFLARQLHSARLVAVEPNPNMQPRLQAIAASNQRIEVLQLALSDSVGTAPLRINRDPLTSSLRGLDEDALELLPHAVRHKFRSQGESDVRVSTLDHEFSHVANVLLLKLDTQGTELEILRGGRNLLKRTRYIITEMTVTSLYDSGCLYWQVDDYLRTLGFVLRDLIVTYRSSRGLEEYDAFYVNGLSEA